MYLIYTYVDPLGFLVFGSSRLAIAILLGITTTRKKLETYPILGTIAAALQNATPLVFESMSFRRSGIGIEGLRPTRPLLGAWNLVFGV